LNLLFSTLLSKQLTPAKPKGDLSVLLGSVPEYAPLEVQDGFPIAPVTDTHPYHIVVVAGQECPTESGVPRGLGGGVIRGMKLGQLNRKDKDKDKKEKDKDKDKRDDKEEGELGGVSTTGPSPLSSDKTTSGTGNSGAIGTATVPQPQPQSHLAPGQDDVDSESPELSRAASPALSHTPTLHRHMHPQNVKGWSSMLDGELRSFPRHFFYNGMLVCLDQ
jgi:hypothetical protein